VFRSSNCYVQSTEVDQKAQSLLFVHVIVATDAVQDHHVLFLTLKIIDGANGECEVLFKVLGLNISLLF
jgi:hypothetical protein